MINLLKFYIPNIVKNILLIFALAIGVSVICLISPLNGEVSEKIIGVIFFLIFPLYVYFNPSNYLSASLGWILQTPVSKKSIILVNGILNIFKIVFVFLLVNLLYFIAGKGSIDSVPVIGFFQWLLTDDKTSSSAYAIQDQFFVVFVIAASLAVLFGILPDLLNNAQERRNQGAQFNWKSVTPKKVVKNFVGCVIALTIFVSVENDFLPPFLVYNLFLSLLVLGSIYLTLKSVKYIYKIEWPIGLALAIFVVGAISTYQIARHQVSDSHITLDKRLETADFLGNYGGNAYDILFKELISGNESTIDIGRSDLVTPVLMKENEKNVGKAIESLEILCKERSDHTCRLYGYIVSIRHGQKVSADFIRLGCPKDLASCSILSTHADAKAEDIKLADSIMSERCKADGSELDGKICKSYYAAKARAEKRIKPKT